MEDVGRGGLKGLVKPYHCSTTKKGGEYEDKRTWFSPLFSDIFVKGFTLVKSETQKVNSK